MDERPLVALLGEDRGHRSHVELDALRPRREVATTRVPSGPGLVAEDHDGAWLDPGPSYADAAVLPALTGAPAGSRCIPLVRECSAAVLPGDPGVDVHVLRARVTRP